MTIFDLLFLLAALAFLFALVAAAYQALRGRGARATAILRRIGVVAVVYFATVMAVSIATPAESVPIGSAQCFDDWCITVVTADRAGDSLHVALRLSSRARGISQGERDVRVYLRDEDGQEYLPTAASALVPLSVTIPPQGEVAVGRDFALPATVRHPVLLVAHDRFPHCCIIGDRESFLHRATVVPLP